MARMTPGDRDIFRNMIIAAVVVISVAMVVFGLIGLEVELW